MINDKRDENYARVALAKYYGATGETALAEAPFDSLRELLTKRILDEPKDARICATCESLWHQETLSCPYCGTLEESDHNPLDLEMVSARSPVESRAILSARHKSVLKAHWDYIQLLFTVSSLRLYRPEYPSFDAWVGSETDHSASHARALILLVRRGFTREDMSQFGQTHLVDVNRVPGLDNADRRRLLKKGLEEGWSVRTLEREARTAADTESGRILTTGDEETSSSPPVLDVVGPAEDTSVSGLAPTTTSMLTFEIPTTGMSARVSSAMSGGVIEGPLNEGDFFADFHGSDERALRVEPVYRSGEVRTCASIIEFRLIPVAYADSDEPDQDS